MHCQPKVQCLETKMHKIEMDTNDKDKRDRLRNLEINVIPETKGKT